MLRMIVADSFNETCTNAMEKISIAARECGCRVGYQIITDYDVNFNLKLEYGEKVKFDEKYNQVFHILFTFQNQQMETWKLDWRVFNRTNKKYSHTFSMVEIEGFGQATSFFKETSSIYDAVMFFNGLVCGYLGVDTGLNYFEKD